MSETGVINTLDQRRRAFVSSTLQELAAERRARRAYLRLEDECPLSVGLPRLIYVKSRRRTASRG